MLRTLPYQIEFQLLSFVNSLNFHQKLMSEFLEWNLAMYVVHANKEYITK